jgi:hypothetical protein
LNSCELKGHCKILLYFLKSCTFLCISSVAPLRVPRLLGRDSNPGPTLRQADKQTSFAKPHCNFDTHTPNVFQHYLLFTVYLFYLHNTCVFSTIHLSYSLRSGQFIHAQITVLLPQSTQFLIFVMQIFTAHKLRVLLFTVTFFVCW